MWRFPDCFVTAQFISHSDIPSLCPEKTKADLFPNNKGKWWGCMKLLPYFQWVSARLLSIFELLLPSIAFSWSKVPQNTAHLYSTEDTAFYSALSYGAADTCTVCSKRSAWYSLHQQRLHWACWKTAQCIHLVNVYTIPSLMLHCGVNNVLFLPYSNLTDSQAFWGLQRATAGANAVAYTLWL